MKSFLFQRGLAAFCLLCAIVPLVKATVVQIGTITNADSGIGTRTFQVGGNWIFNLHDPAGVPLTSATLEIETAVTVSIFETNYTASPMLFTPSVNFSTLFGLFSVPAQDVLHLSDEITTQYPAASFTLAPNESRNVVHSILYRTTYKADTAVLAELVGTGNGRLFLQANVLPFVDRGTTNVVSVSTARLTFNVDDAGTTASMFMLGLGCVLVHRRKRRS